MFMEPITAYNESLIWILYNDLVMSHIFERNIMLMKIESCATNYDKIL